MSTLKTTNLQNADASSANIVLGQGSGGGATITGVTTTTTLQIADDIIHTGDTNTKIRFPDADTVSVETGGSERARIDSAGRLMLATTSTSGISGSGDDIIIGSIGDSTSRGITFATTADGTIRWADSGDNAMGRIQYLNNTDVMSFHTANATRLQISATGKISIGGASNDPPGTPDGNLHIQDGSAGSVTASTAGNLAVFEDSASNGISILVPAAERANIYFGTPGTGGQIEGGIQYAHESVSTAADRRDMIFRAGGGEKVRIQGTGGISFNGDNTSANALDDYEEGTHTVSQLGSGGGVPLTQNIAYYTKIGDICHIHGMIDVGASSGSSSVEFSLPFTSKADTGSTKNRASFALMHKYCNMNGSYEHLVGYVGQNENYWRIYNVGDNNDWHQFLSGDFTANQSEILYSLTFKVA